MQVQELIDTDETVETSVGATHGQQFGRLALFGSVASSSRCPGTRRPVPHRSGHARRITGSIEPDSLPSGARESIDESAVELRRRLSPLVPDVPAIVEPGRPASSVLGRRHAAALQLTPDLEEL